MNKLNVHQMHEKNIIEGLFNIWKSENLDDNLTMQNATDPNAMDWYGVSNEANDIVGFYAVEKRLKLLAIIYVDKKHRHQGIAKKIVDMSNCSGIQLGFYDQSSLQKTKDAFKEQGYTEHRVLVYKTPLMNMAVGEVLSKPETSKTLPIPGLHYINSDDKNLVRV